LRNSKAIVENILAGNTADNLLMSFGKDSTVKDVSKTIPVVTSQGYLGIGPSNTLEGDVVVVIFGLDVPILLRR
jgi:hypothetical protein